MSARKYSNEDLAIMKKDGLAAQLPEPKSRPLSEQATESQEQQATIRWWSSVCGGYGLPEIALMSFPLQGQRTPKNGARMKREGCRKGTLDMLLFVARGGRSCLWLENKTEKGRLTKEQEYMRSFLITQGADAYVCRSHEEQKIAIIGYLKGDLF